jgi:hypothetical protein
MGGSFEENEVIKREGGLTKGSGGVQAISPGQL